MPACRPVIKPNIHELRRIVEPGESVDDITNAAYELAKRG